MTTEIGGIQAAGKIIKATSATEQSWADAEVGPAGIVTTPADAGKPLVASATSPYTPSFQALSPDALDVSGTPATGETIVRTADGYAWGHPSIVRRDFTSDANTNAASGETAVQESNDSTRPFPFTKWDHLPSITAHSRLHSANSGGTTNTATLASQAGYTTGTKAFTFPGGNPSTHYYFSFTTPAIDNDTPGVRVYLVTDRTSADTNAGIFGYAIENNADVRGWFSFTYYANELPVYTSDAGLRGNGSTAVSGTATRSFYDARAFALVWGDYNSSTNDTLGPQHAVHASVTTSASAVIPIGTNTIAYRFDPSSSTGFSFRGPSNSYALKQVIAIV